MKLWNDFCLRVRAFLFNSFLGSILLVNGLWIGSVRGQVPANARNWYFGNGAGITFNGGALQAVTNGQLRSMEGCASQSDANGQLLFYTDGSTIWNRNHEVMPGAVNLGGGSRSTQSALIVPYQNSSDQFYVFSVASSDQPAGIQYSIVSMNLNSGLGGLTVRNKPLLSPSSEKITTIYHCNNLNHWIITHELTTNAFRVYLLNDNGLILTPKVYNVGSVHQSLYRAGSPHRESKGYMKPSHDGKLLAVAVSDSVEGGFLELFDFDNQAGAISNARKLEVPATVGAYGLEFSPDNSLIYLSTLSSKKIYQIRVSDLAITATLTVQAQRNASPGVGALQIGPDGKLYGSQPGEDYLMAINQPNQVGAGCDLVSQAIYLGGRKALAGLPFNVDTIPRLLPKVNIELAKLGGCNNFLLSSKTQNLDVNYLSYQWYLNGTAVTGATSSTLKPEKSGTYLLKVREGKCADIHMTSTEELAVVLVEVNPTVTSIPDSCGQVRLNAQATGGTPQWTGPGINVANERLDSLIVSNVNGVQTYRVRVTSAEDASCFAEKDVTASFTRPSPFRFVTSTQTVCGDTLTLRATPNSDWDAFSWQLPDGRSLAGATLLARQNGQYTVTARSTKTGCMSRDSQMVTLNPYPKLQLTIHQIDTCFANANPISLDAGVLPDVVYSWLKAGRIIGTEQVLRVNDYGWYTINVRSSAGCQASDSVRVSANCPPTPPVAYVPDIFTPNRDGTNETLMVYSTGAESMTLTIFNRWGEPVYEGISETAVSAGWSTWDGTFKGQPVGTGLYVYRLAMKNSFYPAGFTRKGVIEVIR
ncbi:T9SS type B sorting domain-containing protein [Spirosoma aerolatum]|uniref:T9SS type B sorting domain-containing protein n=1 Tax=Spirosoma aerolatum TaxID=1211326 RepID=UPI0009AEE401|nr:gliding motility-associated C-terminal domain-containing protein [Spirosoma aerolatum]